MDASLTAAEITPYVVTAIGAYGTAVLTRARDQAADATVSLGREILQRFARRNRHGQELESVVRDVAEDPQNPAIQEALRGQLRRILQGDPELAAELGTLLAQSGARFTTLGERAVNVGHMTGGNIVTGDHNRING
ncbi:hypothetical protein CG723_45475 [Streptomyces sp. CB01635]|uniref:hypothetical protein n=1 Tax=unclassified Streptomyces TaxID=2593676 RepID=UPI000C28069F|nr:hypothetical protein [Streptomyces sp. CB01635]PJN05314.1 hypothetical protein CG723_45475 [Streptomyces sp. CB01635]